MLWLSKRVIFGDTKNAQIKLLKDINIHEGFTLILLMITTIFFGFYPEPLIETFSLSVNNLIENYQSEINTLSITSNK